MKSIQNSLIDLVNVAVISPDGVVTYINRNGVSFFRNAHKDDFVGMHVEHFFGKEETVRILEKAANGKVYEICQELHTGPYKSVVFRQKFIPINKNGKLQRILMLSCPENV